MAKFGIEMLSGKSYEVEAKDGDEAKAKVYDLVRKDKGDIPPGDPDRRVKQVTPLEKRAKRDE